MFKKSSQGPRPFMFVFFCILLFGWADTTQAYTMMGDVRI